MTRYALIIGISEYQSSHLSKLDKAATDAEEVAKVLETSGDFQVERLPKKWNEDTKKWEVTKTKSVAKEEIITQLKELLWERGAKSEILIYFAGHGIKVFDDLDEPQVFLACSNCQIQLRGSKVVEETNGISLDTINRLIAHHNCNISRLVMLLDCCHSGSLLESQEIRKTLTVFSSETDYYFITACRSFEQARGFKGEPNSIFTGALLKGLSVENANPDGTVTTELVFNVINNELKDSGQEPIHMGGGRSITLVKYSFSLEEKLDNTQLHLLKNQTKLQEERSIFLEQCNVVLKDLSDKIQFRGEIKFQLKKLQLNQSNDCNYNFLKSSTNRIYTIQDLSRERLQVQLILGDPGVGKTTVLLKLAEKYLRYAREDINSKLPIYLNLSDWNGQKESIYDWLTKEINRIYRVESKVAEFFFQEHQMILFLDGLDEVKDLNRSIYVKRINNFLNIYNYINIVISCRTQEYLELLKFGEHFKTGQIIHFQVQLLDDKQISNYLNNQDNQGRNLQQLIQKDNILNNLARTPLMLKIMTQIEILKIPDMGSLENRRQSLIDAYIEKTFNRQIPIGPWSSRRERWLEWWRKYDQDEAKQWLTWLSKHMPTSTFFIEEMQPDCLTKSQKKTYHSLVVSMSVIIGFFFGVFYGIIHHYYLSHLYPQTTSSLEKGLSFGIFMGLINALAAAYFQKLYKQKIETHIPLNKFSLNKYWQEIRKNISSSMSTVIGIVTVVFLGSLLIMPTVFQYYLNEAILTGLFAGSFFGTVALISTAIQSSFVSERNIHEPAKPNQGIRDLRNLALKLVIVSSVSIYMFYIIVLIVIDKTDLTMLIMGLCVAVITGFFVAVLHISGRSYRLHYILRLVLVIDGCIPWNYERFLNYARELTLMKRIGGGYQFEHQYFKEYFMNKVVQKIGQEE